MFMTNVENSMILMGKKSEHFRLLEELQQRNVVSH